MSFNPCVILDFRPRPRDGSSKRPQNRFALEVLKEAERLVDIASDSVQAGICNASAGIATARLGAVSDGCALSATVRASLELMNLRANPSDQPLRAAMEEWLYQRGNGNG